VKCPHDYKQAVTSELDIYRAASILMRDYGAEQALLIAAKRADPLLDRGDADGQRMWKAVLRALQELIRTERRPGELVN
jgi:hypothetical protein